ncbi:MAG: helix-turn-helix transcriptional regulator [Bacteroidales bacterium]|nr:helix-turn-helix transcriptional regulator [Bacteroidales bacterium]
MALNKEEIISRFRKLSGHGTPEEHYRHEGAMIHFRIMQLVEQAMVQKGWNKRTLAEQLGTSKSYVTQLFTGSKLVNLTLIAKLQDVLDIEFDIVAMTAGHRPGNK